MSARSYESVVREACGPLAIRVWRTEPHGMPMDPRNSDICSLIEAMREKFMFDPTFTPSLREIVDEIAAISRVSAVEVWHQPSNQTLLLYVDWPA
jgi:hypothetical protein